MRETEEKRILVMITYPVGGIRTYIQYNYPILADRGYRFTFCAPARDDFRQFRHDIDSWDGAEFVESPTSGKGGKKCMLWRTARSLLRQRRFCLVHSHGLGAGCHTAFANLGLGLPHVITSHGLVHREEHPGLLGVVKLKIIERLLRRATAIVAVSNDARENHLDAFPGISRGPCKLLTIVNGIDTNHFAIDSHVEGDPLRALIGVAPDTFLIGYLGRFMPEKGFLILLEALERIVTEGVHTGFHLLAVGSGDYAREYRAKAAASHTSGYITFQEYTPDIRPILNRLDLLVVPSLSEACPLLPMEAMATGIPVIGTDCPGLREVLRDTPSVVVRAGDSLGLKEAISKALRHSSWKTQSLEYAYSARVRFDVRARAEQLCDFFEQLRIR